MPRALAENLAYLGRNHVRFDAATYLQLRGAGDLEAVRQRWETPVLLIGDFNDEPFDRSLVSDLQASSERDRVAGPTNDIDGFTAEVADYTGGDIFLYDAMWPFLSGEQTGTFFLDSTSTEAFANRYQVLDHIVVSRGLLTEPGLRLDLDSVRIIDDDRVATPTKRPRGFNRETVRGTSDHLPIVATLVY